MKRKPDKSSANSKKETMKTPRKGNNEPKPINLALQGGGSHGSFTWGVLDQLLQDDRVKIEAISGASAGAMNAVCVADGLMKGGKEGAIEVLEGFWGTISDASISSPIQRSALDIITGNKNLDSSPNYLLFDMTTRLFSQYELNPFNTAYIR